MALPSSGQLSFSMIETEIGGSLNNVSLRNMSDFAGFSTPNSVSKFYGWSASVTSDIGVRRWVNGYALNVQIQETTNPQTFASDYTIGQSFFVTWYNYEFDYSFGVSYYRDFLFDSTLDGEFRSYNIDPIPNSFPQFGNPNGNPNFNNNGLPVNLVNWF